MSKKPKPTNPLAMTFTREQKMIVGILVFLQFTIILDFMILSPLGAILMPALNISTDEFGWVVSAYAFSAGISGFLAAGFADRYDRKNLLLFFYVGFILGTLLCALAPNYKFLLAARTFTGIFGGVIGSVIFAIVTDLFPMQMRGRVMGFLQTAFAASQVMGLPLGLYFANKWGWHSPFLMIVIVSTIAGFFIVRTLPPIRAHLTLQSDRNAFQHLAKTVTTRRYADVFATMALMSLGGFMLMPFGSAFSVNNLRIDIHDIPLMYIITGVFAILTGPLIGMLSDRLGQMKVFSVATILGTALVIFYTRLGETSFIIAALWGVLLFSMMSGRMISSSALISGIPGPADRGAFMSVIASGQQVAGGFAAIIAGKIVYQTTKNSPLENFDILGLCVAGGMMLTMFAMYFISKKPPIHHAPQKAA